MAETKPWVLRCKALCHHFASVSTAVLNQVNFSLCAGESVAILGRSGSGKSTLLNILAGLETASSGEVECMGKNLQQLSESERCRLRNQHLGFVFQFHHLLAELSALENVSLPLRIRGVSALSATITAKKLLQQLQLADRANHAISQLSGGERQRIAIARALITNPSCLLADEPTGNLDHNTAKEIYALLNQVKQQTSLLIVTHDLNLAKQMDSVLYLEQGTLQG